MDILRDAIDVMTDMESDALLAIAVEGAMCKLVALQKESRLARAAFPFRAENGGQCVVAGRILADILWSTAVDADEWVLRTVPGALEVLAGPARYRLPTSSLCACARCAELLAPGFTECFGFRADGPFLELAAAVSNAAGESERDVVWVRSLGDRVQLVAAGPHMACVAEFEEAGPVFATELPAFLIRAAYNAEGQGKQAYTIARRQTCPTRVTVSLGTSTGMCWVGQMEPPTDRRRERTWTVFALEFARAVRLDYDALRSCLWHVAPLVVPGGRDDGIVTLSLSRDSLRVTAESARGRAVSRCRVPWRREALNIRMRHDWLIDALDLVAGEEGESAALILRFTDVRGPVMFSRDGSPIRVVMPCG